MDHATDTDIREMLDHVASRLSWYQSEFGSKQSFTYEVRHFYNKLFFNPGMFVEKWRQKQEEAGLAGTVEEILIKDPDTRRATITSLATFRRYLVSVQVVNPVGLGPSSTVVVRTGEGGG